MSTLAQLQTLVQRYGFDTGDPVTDAINRAMYDCLAFSDWPWAMGRVTNVTMGGTDLSLQSMPVDVYKVVSLRNTTTGVKLRDTSPETWDRECYDYTVRGAPNRYTIIAGSLSVFPLADQAYTFSLTYRRAFGPLVNAGDIPCGGYMPQGLQLVLPDFAASWLLRMENEEDRATSAYASYLAALNQEVGSASSLDSAQTVVDVMGYGS